MTPKDSHPQKCSCGFHNKEWPLCGAGWRAACAQDIKNLAPLPLFRGHQATNEVARTTCWISCQRSDTSAPFLPILRAFESPMAIAYLRLFTVPPLPPLPPFRVRRVNTSPSRLPPLREAYSGRSPEDEGLGASPSGVSACSARTRRIRTSKASGRKGFVTKGRWRYSARSNAGLLVMKTNGIPSVSSILAIGNTIPSPRLISSNAKSTLFRREHLACFRYGSLRSYHRIPRILDDPHEFHCEKVFVFDDENARHDQASPPNPTRFNV